MDLTHIKYSNDKNYDEILEWLNKNKKHKKYEDKLCHIFHLLITNNDIPRCTTLVRQNNIKLNTFPIFECQKQLGILLIQYYLHCSDFITSFDNALNVFKYLLSIKEVRKRHLNIILTWLINKDMDVFIKEEKFTRLYLDELIPNFTPDIEEVYLILKITNVKFRSMLLETVLHQPIYYYYLDNTILPNDIQLFDPSSISSSMNLSLVQQPNILDLKKYYMTYEQILCIQNKIKDVFISENKLNIYDSYIKWLSINSSKYNIIIDGANILYALDRKITPNGYRRINQMINHLKNKGLKILLILHKRHFKLNKYKKLWPLYDYQNIKNLINTWINTDNQCITYQTPYNMNDDLFLILASIYNESKQIITNDKFRDHIFKFSNKIGKLNLISQWKQDYGINYKFAINFDTESDHVSTYNCSEYSSIVQKSIYGYYIPTSTKFWLFIPNT